MAAPPRHLDDADGTLDAPSLPALDVASTLAGAGGSAPEAQAAAPGPGTTVGRYVVLSRLGAGAMGVVFAAYDPELDRKVALKLLKPRGRTDEDRARKRLHREAQVLAQLNHTHVVTVHDVGVHEGAVFVAMEFVAGQTVRERLADRPRARRWQTVVSIFEAAGEGLAAAHAADLIHRDFKPDNVMIGDDERVRVMDFGLARAALGADSENDVSVEAPTGPVPSDLTKTGDLAGTPAYMAPEQFVGNATTLCDQFAFCVALFESLYGTRPFRENSWSDLLTKSERVEPTSNARVPAWLLDVIERGLSLDPAERYPDMGTLLRALRSGDQQTRRRWLVGGALILAAVVAGAVAVPKWSAAQRAKACLQTADEVETIWNDETKNALPAAIKGTKVEYAAETSDRITSLLDAQAEAWSDGRVEACRAARVERDWEDDQLASATRCLDDRLLELESLIDELVDTDPVSVRYAAEATSRLGAIAPCLDPRPRSGTVAAVDDPGVREVRAAIWHARTQINAHRVKEAHATAVAAAAEAETLGHPELAAAARLHAGWALDRDGRYEDARTTLERAYFDAVAASATDVQIESATRLSFTVAYSLGRREEGLLWSRLAETALDQRGAPQDDLRRALMLDYRGSAYASHGRFEEAAVPYDQALTIRAHLLGEDHPAVATSLSNIGANLLNMGNIEAAQSFMQRCLEVKRRALGRDHPDVAFALGNLANVASQKGDFAESEKLYRQAMELLTAIHGDDHPLLVPTLANLASVQTAQGQLDEARSLLEHALPLAKESIGPNHPTVGALFNGLGALEYEAGNLDASLTAFERALEIYRATLSPDDVGLAESIENVAEVQEQRQAGDVAAELRAEAAAIRKAAARDNGVIELSPAPR